MNSREMVAVEPLTWLWTSAPEASLMKPLKVPATMEAKAPTTSTRVRKEKMTNRRLARRPMLPAMTSPMERPLLRREANREPKSCTPPKKMPPTTTQMKQGSQPKTAAWMGPLMGPAPAMDEKWWPSTTGALEGM